MDTADDDRPSLSGRYALMTKEVSTALADRIEAEMMATTVASNYGMPGRSGAEWGWGANHVRPFADGELCAGCRRRPKRLSAHVFANGIWCTDCAMRSYAYESAEQLVEAVSLLREVGPDMASPMAKDWLVRANRFIGEHGRRR